MQFFPNYLITMTAHIANEHDLMYLVSVGIEWNFTILSNASGVSHDSFISISEGHCCDMSSPMCGELS